MLKLIENLGCVDALSENISVIDSISLDFDDRKRGRLKTFGKSGEPIGLFLERGKVLQDGDILLSECGKRVRINALVESVVVADCADWQRFSRCCYHLGNRHVPLQVEERWICFKPDHVLEEMVKLLGLSTRYEERPFNPENGAYHNANQRDAGHHHH